MNKSNNKNSRTSNEKKIKAPNYDANQSRIKINKIIEEKNAERMRRKIKAVFVFIFIGILISSTIIVLKLPYFDIKSIEVKGNSIYTKEEVILNSSSNVGENIFIEKIFGKPQVNLPYIESVKTKISLPSTLKIIVTERTSCYFSFEKENNVYYRLDKNGYILEKCDNISLKADYECLIVGIGFSENVELGTKIDEAYISKLNNFTNLKQKLDKNMSDVNVTSVNFENSLTTVTLDDKLNVKFSENCDLNYTISLLKAIIEKLPEGSAGIIDMTKTDPIFSSY